MTKYLVVDASFAIRLVAPHPTRDYFKNLANQWLTDRFELCAPSLWLYEVASATTKLVRFGDLNNQQGTELLQLLQNLGVTLFEMDASLVVRAFEWTIQLNRAAAYDSFYLALAEKLGCDFWTADKRLANAVQQPWVKQAVPQS
ncbi:type II toxin-antitoxin system VapC family toxin [Candidatus Leptofilum sp.]|uniref:type II toxin-antitoxin system VapC family toxin n=1 Tax=Candidatus Leptofilum sp. TaxID=3241576 RepID=UPI003B5C5457